MSINLSELIAEQRKGLVDLMKSLRQSQVKAAREAARSSASRAGWSTSSPSTSSVPCSQTSSRVW